MSEENVEIVRSIYEAFGRREWDAVFRDTAPDVELTTPPGGPNSGTYRGREECEGYLRELITPFEASAVQPEEFFERGDQVAVVYKVRARPKGSSAEIEIRGGGLWTIRGGKAVSLRFFSKPEEALETLGLSE
jgi:ketosteroid isomerase-like protein